MERIDYKLKPCPFCGSQVRLQVVKMDEFDRLKLLECFPGAFVECDCGAGICGNNAEEVCTRWNARAEQKEKQKYKILIPTVDGDFTPVLCDSWEGALKLCKKVRGVLLQNAD